MMMADKNVLIDTNILLYSNSKGSPFNEFAINKLKELDDNGFVLFISRQVIREYLSVKSNLQLKENKYNAVELADDITTLESQYFVADENKLTTKFLIELMVNYNVGGKQIHDCNLVATAKANNITNLLTHNVKDFLRFNSEIDIISMI